MEFPVIVVARSHVLTLNFDCCFILLTKKCFLQPILGGSYWMSNDYTNMLYAVFAAIHFINAWQFAYGWYGRKWYDVSCCWRGFAYVIVPSDGRFSNVYVLWHCLHY